MRSIDRFTEQAAGGPAKRYMIVFDEWHRELIDDTLADQADRLREDGDAVNNRLAGVLENLAIVPVPEATPNAPDQATGDPTALPLVARLIHANATQTAAAQRQVIAGLEREVDLLQARLELIKGEIHRLFDQEWMPHPRTVIEALDPEPMVVERRAKVLASARRYWVD